MEANGFDRAQALDNLRMQLSFDEKLRIAIETLLTGQLKDNHDDTLFEKLYSHLQFNIETDKLTAFVEEQNIFKLINEKFSNTCHSTVVDQREEDLVALFRIAGALFSHEQVFKLYLLGQYKFDFGILLHKLFTKKDDQSKTSKILTFALLSYMKNLSSHQLGAENLDPKMELADHFFWLLECENTHYIQKEVHSIYGNLINFSSASSYHAQFNSKLNEHLFKCFDISKCKTVMSILVHVSDQKRFLNQHKIIDLIIDFISKNNLCEDVAHLIKFVCFVVNIFSQELTKVEKLLELIFNKLYSSDHCLTMISFLTQVIHVDYSFQGFNSIQNLWLTYIRKMLFFVKRHYLIADQAEEPADEMVLHAFNTNTYQSFEASCFKILNLVDVHSLPLEHILVLAKNLKPIITKLTNRKNIIFILTFFDAVAQFKCDDDQVLYEIFLFYSVLLKEMPLYRSFLLTSLRKMFQSSTFNTSVICSDLILPRICDFFQYFNEYLKKVNCSTENELVDIIIETIFQCMSHMDFQQINSNTPLSVTEFFKSFEQTMQIEFSILENEDLEPSARANIISSLYCIYRYDLSSKNIPISIINLPSPNPSETFKTLFSSVNEYDSTLKQTLYLNLETLLTHSISISKDECQFLLPLICEFCIEESDTELECLLLSIIERLSLAQLNFGDAQQNFDLFLKSGLFCLIYFLVENSLILYRVKIAALSLHEIVCSRFKEKFNTEQSQTASKSESTIKGVSIEKIFQVCLSSAEDLRKSIEEQRDCPSVDILDDIISTSLITEDMVMDCY